MGAYLNSTVLAILVKFRRQGDREFKEFRTTP
jgi:hypothetical protein